jgi:chemotaxis protein CheX
MKAIVIATSGSGANIIRGALQQANMQDLDFVHLESASSIGEHLADNAVIFVDWESLNPDVGTSIIKKTKEAMGEKNIPILLVAGKQSSNTTFAGMKAGAKGVISKPIDPEAMLKAIASAIKSSKTKAPSINVEFINPFIEATKNVFQTMIGVNVEREKLYLKNDHKMFGDISGVMGLSGSATGSVVISMPSKLAVKIVAKMLGEEPKGEVTPDTCDAIGEIINMISGQAKASLTKTKYHFQISIPTVVQGAGHEITHKKGTPNIVVMFKAEDEPFAIQVCLSPTDDNK